MVRRGARTRNLPCGAAGAAGHLPTDYGQNGEGPSKGEASPLVTLSY